MFWFKYILIVLVSFILTFIVKTVTQKLQVFEKWNNRRMGEAKQQKVRVGGVAFIITFIVFLPFTTIVVSNSYIWILLGLWIVFMGGLIDDIFDIKPIYKTLIDILGILVVVIFGQLYINQIVLPMKLILPIPFGLNMLLPVVWILAVINIMNLIDGLDGLATGISIISLGAISLVSFMQSDFMMQSLSITLLLSLLGFLPWNWYPSKIIMGDSGSRSIGFLIGCISLIGFKNITFMSVIIPFLILAIPIADTLIAILRRKSKGVSFTTADNGHIHHRLFRHFNGSQVKAVLSIYLITFMFSVSAICYTLSRRYGLLLIVVSIVITLYMFIKIGLISKELFKRKKDEKKENG